MKAYKPHLLIVSMIYVMLYYMTCILDQKLVSFGFFSVPAPYLYFTFIYPLSDAIVEVYGPRLTWFLLLCGYFTMVIFALMTLGIIHLPNPAGIRYDLIQKDYDLLDSAILMCMSFGYLAFFIGMFINVKLLAKFKIKFNGKHYYLRSIVASCVSELAVSIISNVLIWGSRVTEANLIKLIVFGYLLLLLITPIWAIVGKFLKDILYICEGEQAYVYNTHFWKMILGKK